MLANGLTAGAATGSGGGGAGTKTGSGEETGDDPLDPPPKLERRGCLRKNAKPLWAQTANKLSTIRNFIVTNLICKKYLFFLF